MELLIFDLDGTLADTIPTIVRSFNFALEANDEGALPEAKLRGMIGIPLERMFEAVLRDKGKLQACCDTYRQKYLGVCAEAELFPGVMDGLGALPQRKAVATSKRKRVYADMVLEACGIAHFFETVVVAEDVKNPKPAPDMVELALRRTGVSAERAVMIGDTPQDVLAGKAAGTRTIGVTWGACTQKELKGAGADYIAERFGDITGIVGRI